MRMDIRLPIGLLFSCFGLMLTGFGVLSNPAIYQRSLGINVNAIWGIVLLAFGVVMLVLGRSTKDPVSNGDESPDAHDAVSAGSRGKA